MKKDMNNQKLKLILEEIKKLIDEYNALSNEKLSLSTEFMKQDVSDIYVCVYNENSESDHIGLFRSIDWFSNYMEVENPYNLPIYSYDSGNLYISLDSKFTAVRKIHENIYKVNRWQQMGTKHIINGEPYVCNCNIKEVMKFDDLRDIMYNEKLIKIYEPGKASTDEMEETLKYASKYFNLNEKYKVL